MRVLWICAGMIALSGCMAPRIDASSYAVDYNRAVEVEANQTTLLNILRAKSRAPTHYTSIQSISAQLSATRQMTAGITSGEGAITNTIDGDGNVTGASNVELNLGGSAGYQLTYGQRPTFSISSLNTQEFTAATTSPISTATFVNFLEQGYSSQLLWALLVESVAISVEVEGSSSAANAADAEERQGGDQASTVGATQDDSTSKPVEGQSQWRTLFVDNPDGVVPPDACPSQIFQHLRNHITLRVATRRDRKGTPIAELPVSPESLNAMGEIVGERYRIRSMSPAESGEGPESPPNWGTIGLLSVPTTIPAVASYESEFPREATSDLASCLNPADDRVINERLNSGVEISLDHPDRTVDSIILHLRFRSPDGVVRAVGEYLRNSEQCDGSSASGGNSTPEAESTLADGAPSTDAESTSDEAEPDAISESTSAKGVCDLKIDGDRLILVESADEVTGTGIPMVQIDYLGETWSIPNGGENDHRSMEVIGIIQNLINLNRSADELRTPTLIQVN